VNLRNIYSSFVPIFNTFCVKVITIWQLIDINFHCAVSAILKMSTDDNKSDNKLDKDVQWKMIDMYFKQYGNKQLFAHQHHSNHHFMNTMIPQEINSYNPIIITTPLNKGKRPVFGKKRGRKKISKTGKRTEEQQIGDELQLLMDKKNKPVVTKSNKIDIETDDYHGKNKHETDENNSEEDEDLKEKHDKNDKDDKDDKDDERDEHDENDKNNDRIKNKNKDKESKDANFGKKNARTDTEYANCEVRFENYRYGKPTYRKQNGGWLDMYPELARLGNFTYCVDLKIDMHIRCRFGFGDLNAPGPNGGPNPDVREQKTIIKGVKLGSIPIMVGSDYCLLSKDKHNKYRKYECDYDNGGYMIVNGHEKVVVSQEVILNNHVFLFKGDKDKPDQHFAIVYVEELQNVKITGSRTDPFMIKVSQIKREIPLFILFRALGILNDMEIIRMILMEDYENPEYLELLLPSILDAKDIRTEADALEYLLSYFVINMEKKQKMEYIQYRLKNMLLPFIKNDVLGGVDEKIETQNNRTIKPMYIGYMTKLLMNCILQKISHTDRDHYGNKRVDSPGILMGKLFHHLYQKLIKDARDGLQREISSSNFLIDNLSSVIKDSTVENGFKYALATGDWNIKLGKKLVGVAQVLNRLNNVATQSHLRRINTSIDKQIKLVKPRRLNNTHWGFVCVTGETEVLMGNKTIKQIKDLTDGESVMTVNPKTLEETPSRIKNFFGKMPEKLLKITTTVTDGTNGMEKSIKCTPNHPFLVNNFGVYKWVHAEHLQKSDTVVVKWDDKLPCTTSDINGIEELEPEMVYDFTTESDNHSFIGNGFVVHNCPAETPESEGVGLVKNMALMEGLSLPTPPEPIMRILIDEGMLTIADLGNNLNMFTDEYFRVFINGTWVGIHNNPTLTDFLRKNRRKGAIADTVSIYFNINRAELHISCDAGRLYRPLIVVENNKLMITEQDIKDIMGHNSQNIDEIRWDDIVSRGLVEYIDCTESEACLIATFPSDLDNPNNYNQFSHCEMHPSMILGVAASLIPFSERNQSPRNAYQSSMCKQAIGMYTSKFNQRFDTLGYVMSYPQVPLVMTRQAKYLNYNNLPTGENIILAYMSHTGYNQEDSVIVNESAVQRNFFECYIYRTQIDEERRKSNYMKEEKFCNPKKYFDEVKAINGDKVRCTGLKSGNYDKLNDHGFVNNETFVEGDDVIIGKRTPIIVHRKKDDVVYKDSSRAMKPNESGIVEDTYTQLNSDGYTMCKTKIRYKCIPTVGDKFSSRHGQKGTIGLMRKQEDMPMTESGLVPSIIINPHGIPSRMTIGQLLESLLGICTVESGEFTDATTFNDLKVEDFTKLMHNYGFNSVGNQTMLNGETGEEIPCKVFIAPTFYQRLRHMVKDKMHARSAGPVQSLTRQPVEGRARDGGLRVGEMERDVLLAHGASSFINERLFVCSDKYKTSLCDVCKQFAIVNEGQGLYKCMSCTENYSKFTGNNMPYASKLLFQETAQMAINPSFFTEN
jgi:DNA-directed RNA polymerase beta subunit